MNSVIHKIRVRATARPVRWIVAVAAAIAVLGGATAWAQHGPGGWHGGGMGPWGASPEHAARAVDGFLDGLGTSDAQRAQIKRIVQSAASDIAAQHTSERSLHQKAIAVFTAPTVDAAAAEALRAQLQAQQDQSSRRMLKALLDISQVLTPEQRAKLGARWQEREAIMQDRMRRMQAEHHDHDHDGPPGGPMSHGGPDHP